MTVKKSLMMVKRKKYEVGKNYKGIGYRSIGELHHLKEVGEVDIVVLDVWGLCAEKNGSRTFQ